MITEKGKRNFAGVMVFLGLASCAVMVGLQAACYLNPFPEQLDGAGNLLNALSPVLFMLFGLIFLYLGLTDKTLRSEGKHQSYLLFAVVFICIGLQSFLHYLNIDPQISLSFLLGVIGVGATVLSMWFVERQIKRSQSKQ